MKKQIFTSKQHKAFQKLFTIKKSPGTWDIKYIEKTKKYIPYISWIPGLKMVGIGNSLSMNAGSKDSDIDLYIVTSRQSMWTVRILTTLIFQILGVRKTSKKHAGRFCLSFFSSIEGMDFSKFALPHDPYLFFWMVYFQPIYHSDQSYEKFLEINNRWSNLEDFIEIPKCSVTHTKSNILRTGLNRFFKALFLPKTKKSFEKLGCPFGVIISDDLLKFHDHDIRKQVAKKIV